jgi:hypothetical protein
MNLSLQEMQFLDKPLVSLPNQKTMAVSLQQMEFWTTPAMKHFERKQEKVDLAVFVVTQVIHTDSAGQVSYLVASVVSAVAEFVDSSFVAATVVDFEHVLPLGDWELVEMGKETTICLLENRPEASTVGSFETLEDSSFVLCHYPAL